MRAGTKIVTIGDRVIGGGNPVLIQSMCNTKTENVQATTEQILALEKLGCDIIRVAVPTPEAAEAIREIKKGIHIPLVADIHFDHTLAIAAMENGIHKMRINPGNIGSEAHVRQVVDCAKMHRVPIRIGVNSGSLEKDILSKEGGVTARGMVESALRHIRILENEHFDDIVISLKSSSVPTTVAEAQNSNLVHLKTNLPAQQACRNWKFTGSWGSGSEMETVRWADATMRS